MIPRWPVLAAVVCLTGTLGAQVQLPARSILALADDLQLTQPQIDKLRTLESAQLAATSKSTAAFLRAEADLLDAIRGEDLILRRAALEKRSKIAIDAEIARLQAEKDSRAVLLLDQRKKLPPFAAPAVASAATEGYAWQLLVAPPPVTRTFVAAPIVDSGIVRLKVTPSFAEILIDSVKVGVGFKQVSLPVGVHTARFQAPGCGTPVEQTVTVSKGQLVIVPPVSITGC